MLNCGPFFILKLGIHEFELNTEIIFFVRY
jgi:hypothetical protein